MNQKTFILTLIFLIATTFRLWSLGGNPPSLDWDEASLGYNAYSILKTGRDEFGNHLPFSIRSFNDYKPPLYSYLTIPTVAVLGLTEFAVRLPSAVLGVAAVGIIFWLTQLIFEKHQHKNSIALISAFLLAISPWHLQFSRAAFESNIALTFYLLTIASFLTWTKKQNVIWLIISAFSAAATLYSYHSARLVLPLMLLFIAINFRKNLLSKKSHLATAFITGLLLITPLMVVTFRGSAAERFNTVSIFTNAGIYTRESERVERIAEFKAESAPYKKILFSRKAVLATMVIRNYFEHFNLDFLFLHADENGRHHASGMGLMYLIELPLLITGIISLAKSRTQNKNIVWALLLIGPVAASLTTNTPHAIRSLLMLPGLIILTAFGIHSYFWWLQTIKPKKLAPVLSLATCSLFIVNIFFYLNLYYIVSPFHFSQDWQYGYKQLVTKINQVENQYNQIIVTNKYDQPHIYFAFYNQINPSDYQTLAETAHQQIGKIKFEAIDDNHNFYPPGTLIAAEPGRTPKGLETIDQIHFLNGEVAFNIVATSQ